MFNQSTQKTLESMSQAVWYNRWTLNKFKKFLEGEILEIGCGIGNFSLTLTNYGRVWGIDINSKLIDIAKSKVKDKVKLGFGDIEEERYFFSNKKFDSVVCLNVLEHIKNDTLALVNIYKLLKRGGHLILLVPSHLWLYGEIDKSIGHFRRYNKTQLNQLIKSIGFKIIKSRKINSLGAIGWLIAGKLFKDNSVKEYKLKLFNILAPFFLSVENILEPPIGTSILVIAIK